MIEEDCLCSFKECDWFVYIHKCVSEGARLYNGITTNGPSAADFQRLFERTFTTNLNLLFE